MYSTHGNFYFYKSGDCLFQEKYRVKMLGIGIIIIFATRINCKTVQETNSNYYSLGRIQELIQRVNISFISILTSLCQLQRVENTPKSQRKNTRLRQYAKHFGY